MSESMDYTKEGKVPTSFGKLLLRIFIYLAVLGVIFFLLAGTVKWMMGWVFFSVYSFVTILSLVLVPLDQELEEERTVLKKDVKQWDKYLAGIPSILFPFGFLGVGALDQRFDWSGGFPLWLSVVAVVLGIGGYLFSTWAARTNKFYARYVRIQKERGHYTITSGPYGIVRHPGYAGLSIFCLVSPVLLESYWALIPAGLIILLLIVRTALEDKTLIEELPGYAAYTQKTRYRLIPGVW